MTLVLCRIFQLHWWIDRDPEYPHRYAAWKYQYCPHCQKRRAVRISGWHQDQDVAWLGGD